MAAGTDAMRAAATIAALNLLVFIWALLLLDRRLSAGTVILGEPSCRNLAEPGRRHHDRLTGEERVG